MSIDFGWPTGPYTAFLSLMGGPTAIVTPGVYERIVTAVDTQAVPGSYCAPDVGLFAAEGFANPDNCCISITQVDSNRGAALVRVRSNNNNTALGVQSLLNSIGTKNIGIGYRAGMTLQTGNNNI